MKVVFLSDHFTAPSEPGILRTWQLSRHLCEGGHRVTVIAPSAHYLFRGVQPATAESPELPAGLSVRRTWVPRPGRRDTRSRLANYLAQFLLGTWWAWRERDAADVIVAGTTPSVLAIGAYLVARVAGLPFVLEERDLSLDAAAELALLPSWALRAARLVESELHRRSDAIIVPTPGLARMLAARGVSSQVVVIPNGYESLPDEGAPTREELRAELGWGDRIVALYAGGLGHVYDLDSALDALRRLPGDRFLLAVMGEGERKEHYEERARQEHLPVQFLPVRPKAEVSAVCRAADVCLLLLRDVSWAACSLSNKIFDYLGAGSPVIVTGPGDTADLVTEAGAGFVVAPERPGEVAAAMEKIGADTDRAARMGESGRDLVRSSWRREQFADEFEQLLLNVVVSRSDARRRTLELNRIRTVYGDYDASAREQRKRDASNPGTRAMSHELWGVVRAGLTGFTIPPRARVLDVGCGAGKEIVRLGALLDSKNPVLYGVDLLLNRIEVARTTAPGGNFWVGSGDALPLPDGSMDLIYCSTLLSSVLDPDLRRVIAHEMLRVLSPAGLLIVYDIRYRNLLNPNTRPVPLRELRDLFAGCSLKTRSLTVIPPVARRLATRTSRLYPALARRSFLRSHRLTLIQHGHNVQGETRRVHLPAGRSRT